MPVYQALSIKQPWVNLICAGRKTIDARLKELIAITRF